MQPPAKKPAGPKDYVGEQLGAMKAGKAKYESPTQLLQRALDLMIADEEAAGMAEHRDSMRGVPAPEADAPLNEGDGPDMPLPPECLAGECDHPEHQDAAALPEDL